MARPRCPNCREPVSPFAAGCALCGADLEAAPAAARPSLPAVPRPAVALPAGFERGDVLFLLAALVLAFGAPLIGLALIAWIVLGPRQPVGTMRTALLVVGALAVTQLVPALALFPLLQPY